ncbi:MAG: tyrosine-type recombinase/integrase [Simkania sp.]|nr:tyrosine-type recombinase/integrase [Simkania sp.]MCB1074924.1 tyrosine-type recombinase/integrase [Simkania sp.]
MKQWEWISENPVRKISREKEPRERTRFLTPTALELLRNLAAQNQSIGYVFPSPNTKSRPIELRRAFRTAIKRAELGSSFRGHDCRHSYATEMLARG